VEQALLVMEMAKRATFVTVGLTQFATLLSVAPAHFPTLLSALASKHDLGHICRSASDFHRTPRRGRNCGFRHRRKTEKQRRANYDPHKFSLRHDPLLHLDSLRHGGEASSSALSAKPITRKLRYRFPSTRGIAAATATRSVASTLRRELRSVSIRTRGAADIARRIFAASAREPGWSWR
jgi:hypothetical protein